MSYVCVACTVFHPSPFLLCRFARNSVEHSVGKTAPVIGLHRLPSSLSSPRTDRDNAGSSRRKGKIYRLFHCCSSVIPDDPPSNRVRLHCSGMSVLSIARIVVTLYSVKIVIAIIIVVTIVTVVRSDSEVCPLTHHEDTRPVHPPVSHPYTHRELCLKFSDKPRLPARPFARASTPIVHLHDARSHPRIYTLKHP